MKMFATTIVHLIMKVASPARRRAWVEDPEKGILAVLRVISMVGYATKLVALAALALLTWISWWALCLGAPLLIALMVWFDVKFRGVFVVPKETREELREKNPALCMIMYDEVGSISKKCLCTIEAQDAISSPEMMAEMERADIHQNTSAVAVKEVESPRRL